MRLFWTQFCALTETVNLLNRNVNELSFIHVPKLKGHFLLFRWPAVGPSTKHTMCWDSVLLPLEQGFGLCLSLLSTTYIVNSKINCSPLFSHFPGAQEAADLMSPSKRSSQKYIIEGLTEKSSQIVDPWERLFKILNVVGMRCEWQMDKGRR